MIYLYADENLTAFVELETVTGAKFFGRSHDAVIRLYDEAINVIETHEHRGNNLPDGAAPQGFQASVRQMLPTS